MKNLKKIIFFAICFVFAINIIVPSVASKNQDGAIADSAEVNKLFGNDTCQVELTDNYSYSLMSIAFRAFFSLLLIIILIIAAVYFIKKFLYQNKGNQLINKSVNIIGIVTLTPKNSIYLVKIINQILVLGVTESNVSLLTSITDAEVINQLEDQKQSEHQNSVPFKNYLDAIIKKGKNL